MPFIDHDGKEYLTVYIEGKCANCGKIKFKKKLEGISTDTNKIEPIDIEKERLKYP